jgi:hypothetical protein
MSEKTFQKQSADETIGLFLAILAGVLIQGYLTSEGFLLTYLNIILAILLLIPIIVLGLLKKRKTMFAFGSKVLIGLHWYVRVLAGVMFRSGIFLVLLLSPLAITLGVILTAAYVLMVYWVILLSRTIRSGWAEKAKKYGPKRDS